jgi:hypothetical protein
MHWAKCRAAFQNFPFDEGLKTNFEVNCPHKEWD